MVSFSVKPTLKRISKTDTQFDKIKKQNAAKVVAIFGHSLMNG
jgi:hypothetical protein